MGKAVEQNYGLMGHCGNPGVSRIVLRTLKLPMPSGITLVFLFSTVLIKMMMLYLLEKPGGSVHFLQSPWITAIPSKRKECKEREITS